MPAIICRSFNPYSRIIQLVHIHCACLTRASRDFVLREIAIEFGISIHDYGTRIFSDRVLQWIHYQHPEAYPYATGIIGYSSPWMTTLDEVQLILSQKPYLYQGRLEFVQQSVL